MSNYNRTPYVTPHILHKHYAQAYDAETSNCELRSSIRHIHSLIARAIVQ